MPYVDGWDGPAGRINRLVRHVGTGTRENPMQTVVFQSAEWAAISRAVLQEYGLVSMREWRTERDKLLSVNAKLISRVDTLEREITYVSGQGDDDE